MLVRFIKNWTLPLAMLAGTLGYFFFADIPFVAPAKPYVNGLVAFLTPLLIFFPTSAHFLQGGGA